MWLDIFLATFTLFLGLICIGMSYASWRIITHKVPSIPTGKKIAKAMIELAQITENQVVYDLGCGFGDLLFEAQRTAPQNKFTGFDVVDPVIWYARLNAKLLKRNITFVKQDFFTANVTDADIIFSYLWPSIMERIESELWDTLKPGTKLVSHAFILPNIIPVKVLHVGSHKVYLYVR